MRSNTVKNQNNPADPPSGVHQLVLRPSLFFLHSCIYSINIVTVYKLFIQNVHYIVYYIHYTGYINNLGLILLTLTQVPSPRLFFCEALLGVYCSLDLESLPQSIPLAQCFPKSLLILTTKLSFFWFPYPFLCPPYINFSYLPFVFSPSSSSLLTSTLDKLS